MLKKDVIHEVVPTFSLFTGGFSCAFMTGWKESGASCAVGVSRWSPRRGRQDEGKYFSLLKKVILAQQLV